jgi:multiple sugar transport system substrate-binding protein
MINKRKKSGVFFVVFVCVVLFFTNCSKKQQETPVSSDGADGSTIEFWAWNDDEQLSRRVIDAYQAEFPNRKVNITITPVREYPDKLVAAMAANTNIDVMCINGNSDFSELVSRNQLLKLDDYVIKSGFNTSIFGPNFDEQVRYNGSIYSLPYRSSVWLIAYNKTMFEERGVPFPTDDMTWEGILELGQQMTFGSGTSKTYGMHYHTRLDDFLNVAYQNGFDLLSDDFTYVKMGMEQKLKAVQLGVSLPHGEIKSTGLGVRPAFEQKITAMYFTADWTINQMRNSKENGVIDFEFDFAAMPHLPGKPALQTHGSWIHTGVNAKTRNPEAAYQFAQYFAGVPGATMFAAGGTLPAAKHDPTVKAAFIGDRSLPPQNIDVLFTQNVHQPDPISPGLKQINLIFQEEAELAFIGEKTVDDAINAIKSRRAEVLANL